MKKSVALLSSLVGLGLGTLPSFAATSVTTDPVGYIATTIPSKSDAFISAPLHRDAVFAGAVTATDVSVLAFDTSSGWSANQFTYASGQQSDHYYIIFRSGSRRGSYFTIISNTNSSVTVDLNGDSLASVVPGDQVEIIPYWTLATLFPVGGANSFPQSSTFTPAASILMPDLTSAGINLSSSASYYYYSGTLQGGPGWRKFGSPSVIVNDTVLTPDMPFTIRNSTSSAISLYNIGAAPMAGHSSIVGTVSANKAQDNAVALNSAAAVTLANSGLYKSDGSGAILGSSTFTPVDSIFFFDSSATGLNKSSSASYYYYTGTLQGGPGWRKFGAPSVIVDSTVNLEPGQGYVIRKRAQSAPATVDWSFTADYTNPVN